MLHASPTGPFSSVENKRVAFERRSIHELQFVFADPPQVLFDLFFAPVFSVNHDPNPGFNSGQLKHLELPSFDGRIDESIVIRRLATQTPKTARPVHMLN